MGIRAVAAEDHLIDDEGRHYGLGNLAIECRLRPDRAWRDMVRRQFSALARLHVTDDLSDEQLRAGVHLRLAQRGMFEADWHPSARPVGDHLVALLSVKVGDVVTTPPESSWEERGGLDLWLERGRQNLLRLAMSGELEHQLVHGPAGAFHLVRSDRFFTGSTALAAHWLLRRFTPEIESPNGMLVVAPNRLCVGWRPLADEPTDHEIEQLRRFARQEHLAAPGPLTSHVLWLRQDTWTQVTH